MSTNHTTNYDLNQWEGTDKVLRTEFNADNAKIDAALQANAEAIAAEAAEREAAVTGKGNCTLVYGTYVGTGTYNSAGPNTLTFPGKPLAIFVARQYHFFSVRGATQALAYTNSNQQGTVGLSWGETSVSWANSDNAGKQLNSAGDTYYYIALLAADQ